MSAVDLKNFGSTNGRLPPDLRRIAEEELGETDERRSRALETLRSILQEDQELYPRLDTDFLIRFIRVRKYNVDTAARTVKNYYRNRAATTSTPDSLLPSSIKSHVRSLVMVLPQRDVHGRLVLLVRLGAWDPNEAPFTELQEAGFLCLDHMANDPSSQILGISLLVDYKEFSLSKLFAFNFGIGKLVMEYLQECLPVRLKGLHVVRQSYVFDMLNAILRPFTKQKLLDRVHFHGLDFEALHKDISASILPEEYGGQAPPPDFDGFWKSLDAQEALYEENRRHGYLNAVTTEVVTAL